MRLLDVIPSSLVPTWTSGRCGVGGVAKRLDRFVMAETLFESVFKYRSWAIATRVSNHKAICLHLVFDREKNHYPFKFNPIWLVDPDFCSLVRIFWEKCGHQFGGSKIRNLVSNLHDRKVPVKMWECDKKLIFRRI